MEFWVESDELKSCAVSFICESTCKEVSIIIRCLEVESDVFCGIHRTMFVQLHCNLGDVMDFLDTFLSSNLFLVRPFLHQNHDEGIDRNDT